MDESKRELTKRLRRERRWPAASKFKDETVMNLRGEGMTRDNAREEAWRRMADTFPPLPAAEPVSEPAAADEQDTDVDCWEELDWVGEAAGGEVSRWQAKFAITLPDDARAALIGEELMYFWAMGLMAKIPQVPAQAPA